MKFVAAKEAVREQTLQFENVYFKYKEIDSNLEGSRNFYNDLIRIVRKFKDDCKAYSYSQRPGATQIES
jgi:programmed cell death 6-interacting protein